MDPESSTLDNIDDDQPISGEDDDRSGYVFIMVAGILGAVAVLLAILYGYIYCTKIQPRSRPINDARINYYQRQPAVNHSGQTENDQGDKPAIKAHPFFVISYISRIKAASRASVPSTSTNKRY